MKKRAAVLLIGAVLIVAIPVWFLRYGETQSQVRHGQGACVEQTSKTLNSYKGNLQHALSRWEYRLHVKRAAERPVSDRNDKKVGPVQSGAVIEPSPIPLPILQLDIILNLQIAKLLREWECIWPPLRIVGNGIQRYPGRPPWPPCPLGSEPLDPDHLPNKQQILTYSQSVGRLELKPQGKSVTWGTGVLVANGVVATACHVIAPLLAVDPNLQLPDEPLYIDFGTSPSDTGNNAELQLENKNEFQVTGFLGCSDREGFDIAFLEVSPRQKLGHASTVGENAGNCDGKYRCLPAPLPLFSGVFDNISTDGRSVLIGYADFDHFVDPDKKAMYEPWINPPRDHYGKFVLFDQIVDKDQCEQASNSGKPYQIVLDTDSTTMGESGSAVIDMLTKKGKPTEPVIIGIHTCCSAFFEYDTGKPPEPLPNMKCTELRRTFRNQDISSWSILEDPKLCHVLESHGAVEIDSEGNRHNVSCSGSQPR